MSHYQTVEFPERYLNDDVKAVFIDVYGLDASDVDNFLGISNGICEFEMDESNTKEEIAEELQKLNVPAVISCGSSYDYDPIYYLCYPKGDPTYPQGQILEIPCDMDGSPILYVNYVDNKLSSILNNLDTDDIVRQLKEFHDEVQNQNLLSSKVDTKLLGYYSHETDVGRNQDMSAKIDDVLKRLDNNEIDSTTAMKMIKEIREAAEYV